MKKLKQGICLTALSALLVCASCGREKSADGDSGSDSQTTVNDSSGAVSRKALGRDEGKQKEMSGYPSNQTKPNQSNLNSDSTSKRHDVDTIKKPARDKPNKHL